MDRVEIEGSPRVEVDSMLEAVSNSLGRSGITYMDHQPLTPVPRSATMRRKNPQSQGTQDAQTTRRLGGGDCDDLAVLYAHELQTRSGNPNLEFGVTSGYARLQGGRLYEGHAYLTVRDKRYPNRYEFYEVTDLQAGPSYRGRFNRYGPNNNFPTPAGNDAFIINYYMPVSSDGRPDYSSVKYFVPQGN